MSEPPSFHRIAAGLDYPMVIVTARAADERSGCLAGFTTQCSIDPVRHLVCISKANHTFSIAQRATMLVVHVLRRDDLELARLFGEETGDEVDKLARCAWTPGPDGTPTLDGVDWFAGRILDRMDAGDHVGFLLDVVEEGRADRADDPPLGYQAVRHFEAGHQA